jgi:hypothetical protein
MKKKPQKKKLGFQSSRPSSESMFKVLNEATSMLYKTQEQGIQTILSSDKYCLG